jgi:hypothetical protein
MTVTIPPKYQARIEEVRRQKELAQRNATGKISKPTQAAAKVAIVQAAPAVPADKVIEARIVSSRVVGGLVSELAVLSPEAYSKLTLAIEREVLAALK